MITADNVLNKGQLDIYYDAINWFKYSPEQVFEFEGPAGTGKSFLMYWILKGLGLSSNEYLPMAYTGAASLVMRTKGFTTAKSIHSSLYEVVEVYDDTNISTTFGTPQKRQVFQRVQFIDPSIRLFFIDEGYMVPDNMVEDIKSFGIKIIVCGDQRQLPPIGGKPGFLVGNHVRHLTEFMRQSLDNPIIYLSTRATKGLPIHNGRYGNNVLVIDDSEFEPAMIGYADTIICGTNRTRDKMNQYVRHLAGFTDPLPRFGERIICRNNNWQRVQAGIAMCNGLTGTVVSQPDASGYNGKAFTLNFKPDLVDTIFYDTPVNYEYFIAPYDEKQALKEKYRKWMIGEMFEYSYALTCHLAQGSEYEKGIYIEEFMRPQIQNQLNYVGITRFKKGLIYIKKKNKYIHIPKI